MGRQNIKHSWNIIEYLCVFPLQNFFSACCSCRAISSALDCAVERTSFASNLNEIWRRLDGKLP